MHWIPILAVDFKTQIAKEDWRSLPTWMCCEIFFPFLLGYHGIFSQWRSWTVGNNSLLGISWQVSDTKSATPSQEFKWRSQFLVWTRGEVLDLHGVPKAQLNESSAVESIFSLPIFYMVPNYFIFVETIKPKKGPLIRCFHLR